MHEVSIVARDPRRFETVIGRERTDVFVNTAALATELLAGRSIVNINSTAAGGGVAEMLHVLLGYVRGMAIDTRWVVIEGSPAFFELTKRIHNHLYGGSGDGGPLGEAEHHVYAETLQAEHDDLAAMLRPGDLVILHDPQTAGLAEHAKHLGCQVAWRCHVGIDEQNAQSEQGWTFLRPYLEPFVDHYVFTDPGFPPPWIPPERTTAIWPSIDPFSPKNQELSDETVEAILTHVGILAGRPGDTTFRRNDGSVARVERHCDVFRTGPPATPESLMVVQVSRWDVMKDMIGVMQAFADHVDGVSDVELVLAGPTVTAVADDPEGGQVLQSCWEAWRALPHAVRRRVQLVCLPMHDLDENAVIVNALQRHAAIVTQKSLAEGFGLTVAEAMLKRTPVVASAVGGIVEQVIDRETGLLVKDPTDLGEFGAALVRLLGDDELRSKLGAAARDRAVEVHLGDTHLQSWVEVMTALTS
ncbi:MAG: glycosyltransferase [Acidimicrobiia bacterium]|nr:glycosyltransferase [Acidimicrobiia bacterium]